MIEHSVRREHGHATLSAESPLSSDQKFSTLARLALGSGLRLFSGGRLAGIFCGLAILSVGPAGILAEASASTPSPEAALSLQPVQKDSSYQKVAPAEVDKCRVVDLNENGWTGWVVETADGVRLRRFADTNADKKIDLWCYYDQGVEVYRDIDSDFNGKADQYRWMGTAGTRWGVDRNENGKVDYWKQISAEEASAELIAAIAGADADRFARLLATESEVRSLELGKATTDRLLEKIKRAESEFSALAAKQKSVGSGARWVQFASPVPGIVPAGTNGSKGDVRVYENAVAMYDDGGKSGQVLVGTIIQIGEAWRLVDLPQIVADDQPLAQSPGVFFTPGGAPATATTARIGMAAETQELVSALEKIDGQLATATRPEDLAELNRRRVDIVERLIAAASTPAERDTWMRQLVDTVSVAVQSGTYPGGIQRLRKFSNDLPAVDKGLQPYVQFQIISSEYVSKQTADADFAKVQEWYLAELTKFVESFPSAPEAAQAMLQLALSKEFEERDNEALEYYNKVAKAFPGTDMGEKAAGAVRRLDSVGKTIAFSGRTVKGEPFDLARLKGRPVVIHYWATWCESCKQDMKLLRQLQAKYQSAGLQIVGVNVDSNRNMAAQFLQDNSAPWTHLYEDGGLESSGLAKQLGVQTLPMMLLLNADGAVVSNNIYAASLDAELAKIARPIAPTAAPATTPAAPGPRPVAPGTQPSRPTAATPGGAVPARPAAGRPAGK
jgi:thiol-disulfide isomerase/thioredoxin